VFLFPPRRQKLNFTVACKILGDMAVITLPNVVVPVSQLTAARSVELGALEGVEAFDTEPWRL
jgi:hypothetical protein